MSKVAPAGHSNEHLIGALSVATAIAGIVLLAYHPAEQARTFAEVVREEAQNLQQNLIVHGGYIVVLSVQILCFGSLANCVRGARLASRAALTFFAIGVAWMCTSLLFDGLVTPAIALRYVDQPDAVRPLFALISAIVRVAMPLGLGFQALAVCCWGIALLRSGLRISGGIASLLGLGMMAAVGAATLHGIPMAFMAAFAAMSLWALIAGAVLLRGTPMQTEA